MYRILSACLVIVVIIFVGNSAHAGKPIGNHGWEEQTYISEKHDAVQWKVSKTQKNVAGIYDFNVTLTFACYPNSIHFDFNNLHSLDHGFVVNAVQFKRFKYHKNIFRFSMLSIKDSFLPQHQIINF